MTLLMSLATFAADLTAAGNYEREVRKGRAALKSPKEILAKIRFFKVIVEQSPFEF